MHRIIFRVGVGAFLGLVLIMVGLEAAAGLSVLDRGSRAYALGMQGATLFMWAALLCGLVLYPQAWRLYKEQKNHMDKDRSHIWLVVLICGVPLAGYLAQIYLGEKHRPAHKTNMS